MIYLYLGLCCAFMPVYLLCYGVYLLLWICATPPVVVVLLVRCVFVLFACGPSHRASQGIVIHLNVLVMGLSCRGRDPKRSLFPHVLVVSVGLQ